MIPLDESFVMMYLLYGIILFFIIFNLIRSQKKAIYVINFIVFCIYVAFTVNDMSDAENFKYGSSLPILFYGIAFPVLHIFLYTVCFLFKRVYFALKYK